MRLSADGTGGCSKQESCSCSTCMGCEHHHPLGNETENFHHLLCVRALALILKDTEGILVADKEGETWCVFRTEDAIALCHADSINLPPDMLRSPGTWVWMHIQPSDEGGQKHAF